MLIRVVVRPDAQRVEIAPGLAMQAPVAVFIDDLNGFDVEAEVIPESGRLVARRLVVTRREIGTSVTGEVLRTVPVAQITREAIGMVMRSQRRKDGIVIETDRVLAGDLAEQLKRDGPVARTLDWVAHLYRLSALVGDPPTKSVGDVLGVSRATAGRWISQAREQGFLEPVQGATSE